jgi:putative sigma-54 modulation protein
VEVVITSRNVEVPEALRAATTEKISRLARFLDGMDHAEVHFSEEKNPRIADREVCEVTLQGPRRRAIRAKAASPDPFVSVDKVIDKLEHQMEKVKGKRLGRSHPRRHASVDSVPQAEPDEEAEGERTRIVEVKRFPAKPMTPEEAALQLDLRKHDAFFLFIDAETQRAAAVYRRADGGIGLAETT